ALPLSAAAPSRRSSGLVPLLGRPTLAGQLGSGRPSMRLAGSRHADVDAIAATAILTARRAGRSPALLMPPVPRVPAASVPPVPDPSVRVPPVPPGSVPLPA